MRVFFLVEATSYRRGETQQSPCSFQLDGSLSKGRRLLQVRGFLELGRKQAGEGGFTGARVRVFKRDF